MSLRRKQLWSHVQPRQVRRRTAGQVLGMVLAAAVLYTGLPTAAYALTTEPGVGAPQVPAPGSEPAPQDDVTTPPETGDTDPGTETPAEVPPTEEPPVEEVPEADETGTEADAPAAPLARNSTLAAVPDLSGGPGAGTNPGTDQVLIRITASGDRTTSSARANLAGVTLSAYEASSLTDITGTSPKATCTTDGNGRCWMKAPTRGSSSGAPGYVVQADAVPAGWRILSTMNTSSDGLSVGAQETYKFYTGPANSKASVNNRIFTPPNGTSLRLSTGDWASVRENPVVPEECGLDVALLVDLSSSVGRTPGALEQIKNASSAVIDALTGTPSRVALQTFGTVAPAPGANNAFLGLTSVATTSQAAVVKGRANGLTLSSRTQYTNWDSGLWSLDTIANDLDAVIMITDGLPTVYGTNGDGARATRFFEMENAIASANALKKKNVGIIAVGVGLGVSGDSHNLQAISGPIEGTDYFQVTEWNDLAAQMKALASKSCEGTVNVVKQVIPVGASVADAQPRANWGFTATAAAATVRVDTSGSTPATSASGVTESTGVLGFRSTFVGTSQSDRRMSVTESPGSQFTLAPQGGKNAVCTRTDTNQVVATTNIDSATQPGFTVDPIENATVSCVVYNQAQDLSSQLRVNKVWKIDVDGDGVFEETTEPNAAPTVLSGLNAALALSNNAGLPGSSVNFGQTVANLAVNSTVNISEEVSGLPPLCTNTASFAPTLDDSKLKLTKTTAQGINEVTLTNTVTCDTKLTLEKQVTDGVTPVADWKLQALAQGDAADGPAGASGTAAATSSVTAGVVYPLAESPLTPAAEGYSQQWNPSLQGQWSANHALGATGSWVCSAATGIVDGEPVWASNQSDGRNGGVTVNAGAWMKCTAVNEPKPTLELVKQVTRGTETTTVPLGDDRWTLSASWSAPVAGSSDEAITPYPGSQEDVEGAAGFAATRVLPGSYTLAESAAQSGYENGTDFSCVINEAEPELIAAGAVDGLRLESGDAAVCTIVNTAVQPPLTMEKSDGVVAQLADGTWQIDYTITVGNETAVPGTYTLTDTPDFGTGFAVVSSSWRDASDSSKEIEAPVANMSIAGEAEHRYIYRVIASFDSDVAEPELACDPSEGGAFFNSAELTFPGGEASDTGCAAPAAPTVTKTAAEATQDADGGWLLSYTIAVNNTSNMQLAYTLDDTAAALPVGATSGAWTVGAPTSTGGTTADSSELVAGWNGQGTLATGVLSAGAIHTYVVSRTVTIPAATTTEQLACDDGGESGFWNTATVSNGVGGDGSKDCVNVDPPRVDVEKDVATVTHLADGNWNVSYTVTVTNKSAEHVARYSLVDDLRFGGDIEVTGATWTGPGSASGTFTADGTAQLATDRALAADGSETYTVTALATVDPAAWGGEFPATECMDDGGNGGFMNAATVTAAGHSLEDTACAEPALPTITKDAVSAVQDSTDPELWRVSYLLTVTPNGFDTFYSLSDTPDFSAGVVLGAGTAQRTDTDPASAEIAITSGKPFSSEPVAIGGDEGAHTWLVTWEATLAADSSPEQAECEGPGTGFFNSAALTQGGTVVGEDSACIPVQDRVYPAVQKSVVETVQNPDGSWKIEYDLAVTLAGKGDGNPEGLSAKYSLDDVLAFGEGIDVVSAAWAGPGGTTGDFEPAGWSAAIARGAAIGAGDEHTFRVSVVANVTADAVTEEATECVPGGEEAGGFLNTAVLVSGNVITPVSACAEPVHPTIVKTGGETVDNGDGTFGLEYTIAVRYPETSTQRPVGVSFTLQDEPQVPANVEVLGGWSAEAATKDTPVPTNPRRPGTGAWTIVEGAQFAPDDVTDGITEYVYRVKATVKVSTAEPVAPEVCEDTDASGILIPNIGRITSGGFEAEDSGCQVVNFSDVSIKKQIELAEGETSVAVGDTFDYVLNVTNTGSTPATDVKVTDTTINDRLKVVGLTVDPNAGWGPSPGYTGNDVEFVIDEIPVGESVEVRIRVEFLPAMDLQADPILSGAPVPDAPAALDTLTNTACVEMAGDANPDNNCDEVEVPVRDLTATVYTLCVADAPKLGWAVSKSALLKDLPVNFRWTADNATATTTPGEVTLTQPGGSANWADTATWPGSAFTPSGVSIDYPGWRALRASDMTPNGGYFLPGTTTEMTPAEAAEFVFNGLILDPSEIDFAWRGNTTIEFSVNPELTFNASYPPATAGCGVARHTQVEVEKEASVTRTQPGKAFDYTISAKNVSDDSAAEGVVVTDKIPAELRVTDVTWAGKGEPGAFPNWRECEVTGQNSRGFGGTLSCELFGPLQPKGSSEGASEAPTITLSVMVDAGSSRTDITNTAIVDYHTFGDPDDSGRDSDSATVLLWGLSVTGSQLSLMGGAAAMLLIIGGGVLLMSRRRMLNS